MSERYRSYSALTITLDRHLLTVTMDAPPLNAMNGEMHGELARLWSDVGDDPEVRCVVLTGGGDRAFSAGGNLESMIENWGDRGRWHVAMAEARAIIVGMLECPKPIVSRINGHAMGLGASLALAGDITIMVDDARIGDPHVNVGLTTGDGGALLWPHLIGPVLARRYLLSGDPLTGREASKIGLVTTAVSRAELDAAVAGWVETLLAKSPIAVQTTKRALNLELVDRAKRQMGEMLRLETSSWNSPDHPEAVRAILEKRAPNFVG